MHPSRITIGRHSVFGLHLLNGLIVESGLRDGVVDSSGDWETNVLVFRTDSDLSTQKAPR